MGGVVADGDRASLEPTLNEFAETMGKAMGSFEELCRKPKPPKPLNKTIAYYNIYAVYTQVLSPDEQADRKLQKIFKGCSGHYHHSIYSGYNLKLIYYIICTHACIYT